MKTIRLLIIMGIGIILVILLSRIERLVRPESTRIAQDTLRIHLEGEDSVRIARQARLGLVKPSPSLKIMPMKEYHNLLASIGLADTIHVHDTIAVDVPFPVYQSVIDTNAVLAIRDSVSGDSATATVYARATYTLPPVNQHELILGLRGVDIQHTNTLLVPAKPGRWYNVAKWSKEDWKRGGMIAAALIVGFEILAR